MATMKMQHEFFQLYSFESFQAELAFPRSFRTCIKLFNCLIANVIAALVKLNCHLALRLQTLRK